MLSYVSVHRPLVASALALTGTSTVAAFPLPSALTAFKLASSVTSARDWEEVPIQPAIL